MLASLTAPGARDSAPSRGLAEAPAARAGAGLALRERSAGARSSAAVCILPISVLCSLFSALLAAPACEQKISERAINPAFSGMQGVRTEVERKPRADVSVGADAPAELVVEHEDGSVTLIATRPVHLMSHIQRTLAREEQELFVEQVLSEVTKAEYRARGLDPADAFDTLKAHESDIAMLFSRMPFGEASPSVIMSKVDADTLRLTLTGAGKRDLRWTRMDMVFEGGAYRLRWFGR